MMLDASAEGSVTQELPTVHQEEGLGKPAIPPLQLSFAGPQRMTKVELPSREQFPISAFAEMADRFCQSVGISGEPK